MAKRRQQAHREGHRGLQHIDAQVGAKLREYRIRAQLSQAELGARTGVTFQQIQKYEKGSNAIAAARLPAICEALDITPNDLYGTLYRTGTRQSAPQLSVFAAKLAIAVDQLPDRPRQAIAHLVRDLTGNEFSEA